MPSLMTSTNFLCLFFILTVRRQLIEKCTCTVDMISFVCGLASTSNEVIDLAICPLPHFDTTSSSQPSSFNTNTNECGQLQLFSVSFKAKEFTFIARVDMAAPNRFAAEQFCCRYHTNVAQRTYWGEYKLNKSVKRH